MFAVLVPSRAITETRPTESQVPILHNPTPGPHLPRSSSQVSAPQTNSSLSFPSTLPPQMTTTTYQLPLPSYSPKTSSREETHSSTIERTSELSERK